MPISWGDSDLLKSNVAVRERVSRPRLNLEVIHNRVTAIKFPFGYAVMSTHGIASNEPRDKKRQFTRFPGERPEVASYPSCQRGCAETPLISVAAFVPAAGEHFRFKIRLLLALR